MINPIEILQTRTTATGVKVIEEAAAWTTTNHSSSAAYTTARHKLEAFAKLHGFILSAEKMNITENTDDGAIVHFFS